MNGHLLEQITQIQQQNAELNKLTDEQVNELIKGSILLQQLKARIESLEAVKADLERAVNNEALRHQTTAKHLSKILDETEGRFDVLWRFDSCEACEDYIQAAIWMERKFDRKDNRVHEAKEWLNGQQS